MQLAFARVKESWEDAYLTSLAGRPLESVVDRIRTAEKVGLFSSDEHPPARLAQALSDRGRDSFRGYVCENLGSPDERVTQAELEDLATMEFDPLNVLILVRKPNRPDRASKASRYRLFGNADDAFAQTVAQARTDHPGRGSARSHWRAAPTSGRRAWSGTLSAPGSGSVAIEAAQLADQGVVYAIEPEPADLALIEANAESFGVPNVHTVPGQRPNVLARSARARRGVRRRDGAAGRPGLLSTAYSRLAPGGRMAVNVATIDGLAAAYQTLKEGRRPRSTSGTSRSPAGSEQMDRMRFEAINPTFLLAVARNPEAGD